MATKTITLTEEAYNSLNKLVGILSNEEAEKMRKHIRDSRKRMNEHVKKIAEGLK